MNLDVMLAKRKMRSNELAEKIGLTQANLSILKTGKVKAIRLATLDAICRELQCTPGDILEYREDSDWFFSTSARDAEHLGGDGMVNGNE